METRYLIVGGGVAGTTAAETLRRLDAKGSIVIISDEPYPFYARINLSKANYFLGLVPEKEVFLKMPEWYEKNRITLLSGRKAAVLDAKQKAVTLDDGTSITYEKLLLAVGVCARRLTTPGTERAGVYCLRTIDDARAITKETKTAKKAVLIGGGFISFETCEILHKAGVEVTLIIREPYYWSGMLDEDSGRLIEDALARGGITVIKNEEVVEFIGDEHVEAAVTKSGEKIDCDLVVVGIGVFCPVDLAKNAGIAVEHGILTNEYLETNVPDIFAAGDAAEFYDVVLKENDMLGNWVNAQIQGRTAAQTMAGKKTVFEMVSFYTTQAFGLAIAFVGSPRVYPEKEVIIRGSRERGWIERLIVQENKIEGATLVNKTMDLGVISKLIFNRVDITAHKQGLTDPDFDLKGLLA